MKPSDSHKIPGESAEKVCGEREGIKNKANIVVNIVVRYKSLVTSRLLQVVVAKNFTVKRKDDRWSECHLLGNLFRWLERVEVLY